MLLSVSSCSAVSVHYRNGHAHWHTHTTLRKRAKAARCACGCTVPFRARGGEPVWKRTHKYFPRLPAMSENALQACRAMPSFPVEEDQYLGATALLCPAPPPPASVSGSIANSRERSWVPAAPLAEKAGLSEPALLAIVNPLTIAPSKSGPWRWQSRSARCCEPPRSSLPPLPFSHRALSAAHPAGVRLCLSSRLFRSRDTA